MPNQKMFQIAAQEMDLCAAGELGVAQKEKKEKTSPCILLHTIHNCKKKKQKKTRLIWSPSFLLGLCLRARLQLVACLVQADRAHLSPAGGGGQPFSLTSSPTHRAEALQNTRSHIKTKESKETLFHCHLLELGDNF